MPSVSVSMDLDMMNKVNEFSRTEGHKTLSGAINNLIKLGLAHIAILDEQDKEQMALEGKKAHGTTD